MGEFLGIGERYWRVLSVICVLLGAARLGTALFAHDWWAAFQGVALMLIGILLLRDRAHRASR